MGREGEREREREREREEERERERERKRERERGKEREREREREGEERERERERGGGPHLDVATVRMAGLWGHSDFFEWPGTMCPAAQSTGLNRQDVNLDNSRVTTRPSS